jgi:hypothetical protein
MADVVSALICCLCFSFLFWWWHWSTSPPRMAGWGVFPLPKFTLHPSTPFAVNSGRDRQTRPRPWTRLRSSYFPLFSLEGFSIASLSYTFALSSGIPYSRLYMVAFLLVLRDSSLFWFLFLLPIHVWSASLAHWLSSCMYSSCGW